MEAAASHTEMSRVACECRIWETTGKYYSGGFCRVWDNGEHRWHCPCVGGGDGAFQRAQNIGQGMCQRHVHGRGHVPSGLKSQKDETQE